MKSPMNQRPDDEARQLTDTFIAKNTRKPLGKPNPASAKTKKA
jgi:hypothetical protein